VLITDNVAFFQPDNSVTIVISFRISILKGYYLQNEIWKLKQQLKCVGRITEVIFKNYKYMHYL